VIIKSYGVSIKCCEVNIKSYGLSIKSYEVIIKSYGVSIKSYEVIIKSYGASIKSHRIYSHLKISNHNHTEISDAINQTVLKWCGFK